jgi:hypothetical protein
MYVLCYFCPSGFSHCIEPLIDCINGCITLSVNDGNHILKEPYKSTAYDRHWSADNFDEHFIVAIDVYGNNKKMSAHKLSTHCAIIGIESIMDLPNGNEYMKESNIFIVQNGIVTDNNVLLSDVISMFEKKFGDKI